MVLESLIGVKKAERMPRYVFLLGLLYATVAIFLSLWIFRSEASLILVFLIVFASLPLMFKTFNFEAKKDLFAKNDNGLMRTHTKALRLFMYLFIGIVIALSVWYVFLPGDMVSDLFSSQVTTIKAINAGGMVTGKTAAWSFLTAIITNNLKVLVLCVLFSFFYGAGAIFILTWNASVIAAAIGTFVRSNIAQYAETFGLFKVAGYFHIFSLGLLRYMTHGVFEILAYFIGGLAGGLISIAMVNHKFEGEHFRMILKDSLNLFILAVIVLLVAGFIEVFVTPMMFYS
ncbi:MAG TPA: stage II sporulation protein M [Candidatus Nanoarchaeia archaeon]|nr:stage II sporulation protein M [Candidatus Nanoarchaeia archaeon]